MDNLNLLSEKLEYKDGIFFSKNKNIISYPKVGNDNCFQIEQDSFWFNHRNNCIIETVKLHSPDKSFLDIGGGNGFVAKGLQDNNIKSVLIEPGVKGCLNAKKRKLNNVICSTLEEAYIKSKSVPSAGAFDVVEHVRDDLQFLKEIYKILENDGMLYITVPAYKFLWSNEDDDAGHFRRYSIEQMEKKLLSIGFKIKYSTYFFSFLPLPIFLYRTIPSKLGLNKKSKELQKHQKEHQQKKGIIKNILNKIMNVEIEKIKKSKKIPFGGSCLIVAQK